MTARWTALARTTQGSALTLGCAWLAWPQLAVACSVCSGGQNDQVQEAFLTATLFMTLLPLSMIGGAAYALRRRFLQLAAREAADERTQPTA